MKTSFEKRGKFALRSALVFPVLATLALAGPASAKSIFDDDYVPPASTSTEAPPPTPEAQQPAPAAAPTPAPADTKTPPTATPKAPTAPPPVKAAPAPAPSVDGGAVAPPRIPIPEKEDLVKARVPLRQKYAKEAMDPSPEGRMMLSSHLYRDAMSAPDGSPDEFVLLIAAIQAAQDAGSVWQMFNAINAMGRKFMVDSLQMREKVVLGVFPASQVNYPEEAFQMSVPVVDELYKAGQFGDCERVATALGLSPVAPTDVRATLQRKAKVAHEQRVTSDKMKTVLDHLQTTPDDPAGNAKAGSYLCFNKRQWDQGLPMLVKGNDAQLKGIAAKDIAGTDADSKGADAAAIGDAWWTVASKQTSPITKPTMESRALFWYRKSLPDLEGAAKAKVKKRFTELSPDAVLDQIHVTERYIGQGDPEAVLVNAFEMYPEAFTDVHEAQFFTTYRPQQVANSQRIDLPTATYGKCMVFGGNTSTHLMDKMYFYASKQLIVTRIQAMSPIKGDKVCTLAAAAGDKEMASYAPAATEFQRGRWSCIPMVVSLDNAGLTTFDLTINAAGHAFAVDSVDIFELK